MLGLKRKEPNSSEFHFIKCINFCLDITDALSIIAVTKSDLKDYKEITNSVGNFEKTISKRGTLRENRTGDTEALELKRA
jgi:hypothetical protein